MGVGQGRIGRNGVDQGRVGQDGGGGGGIQVLLTHWPNCVDR